MRRGCFFLIVIFLVVPAFVGVIMRRIKQNIREERLIGWVYSVAIGCFALFTDAQSVGSRDSMYFWLIGIYSFSASRIFYVTGKAP